MDRSEEKWQFGADGMTQALHSFNAFLKDKEQQPLHVPSLFGSQKDAPSSPSHECGDISKAKVEAFVDGPDLDDPDVVQNEFCSHGELDMSDFLPKLANFYIKKACHYLGRFELT